jgi:hypothetical protein
MTKTRRLARTALTGMAVLIGLDLAAGGVLAFLRAAPLLLLAAGIWAACLRAHRLRVPRVAAAVVCRPDGRLAEVQAERDELRREVGGLRIELAAARESAEMAWDAAADRPPTPAPGRDAAAARLLAERMSGVRPLFPRGGDL